MKLILLDSATSKLYMDSVGDKVEVFYFSSFDSSSFESNTLTLSFKADSMFNELNHFVQAGEFYICDAGQSFSIKPCGERWCVNLDSQCQSHSILNVDIDVKSIISFINSK